MLQYFLINLKIYQLNSAINKARVSFTVTHIRKNCLLIFGKKRLVLSDSLEVSYPCTKMSICGVIILQSSWSDAQQMCDVLLKPFHLSGRFLLFSHAVSLK